MPVGTNKLYLCTKFEVLTTDTHGDIDQNMVKISTFTLGRESCMKFLVKLSYCTLCILMQWQSMYIFGTANNLQETLNPEANSSVRCSKRAKVHVDDVWPNARVLKWRLRWPHPLSSWNEVIALLESILRSVLTKVSEVSARGKRLAIGSLGVFQSTKALKPGSWDGPTYAWLCDRLYGSQR